MIETIKKYKYEFFAGIIALATLIHRLFYVNLNQGLWWDSASFIIIAQRIFGDTTCLAELHRLPGFSILLAPVVKLFGLNMVVIKAYVIVFAALSVLAVYFLAVRMFKNKNIGIVASIFISLSWLNFFYGLRVLSRVPAALFLLIGVYLFLSGFEKKSWKKMLCSGLIFSFYYIMRFDALFVVGALGIFVLIEWIISKDKVAFIKRKDLWAFAGGFIMLIIPYFVWQMAAFGSPFHQIYLNYKATKNYGEGYFDQFTLMPHIFSTGWLIFFVIGLGFTALKIKQKNYRLLFLITVIFFIGLMISPHHEDRYSLPVLPLWGIVAGIGVVSSVNTIIKKEKLRVVIYIALALTLGFLCMKYGWPIIQNKAPTYASVQTAGIELNNLPNNIIYAPFAGDAPIPQLCLWSQKEYRKYPDAAEEFFENFKEGELAYCSLGYDTCPSYLLPMVSTDQELQGVLGNLQNKSIIPSRVYQDGAGAFSILFEKIPENATSS